MCHILCANITRLCRCLLAVAQSASPAPSERLTLLASIALCRATCDSMLASNAPSLFQMPQPIVSNSNPSEIAGPSVNPTVPSSNDTFEYSEDESETVANGERWGKEGIERFLTTVGDCARAGADITSFSMAPVIGSTKGCLRTLAASALEVAGFAPLKPGQITGSAQEGATTSDQVRSRQSVKSGQLGTRFLESAFEAVSRQTEQASAFLAGEQTLGASSARNPRPDPGPTSLLPRTLLLAAKHRGTAQEAAGGVKMESGGALRVGEEKAKAERVPAASRDGNEGPERSGSNAVGWAESASAAACAGALLKAVEDVMELREQACRAERDAGLTWQVPDATWQTSIDRLENSVVESLSKLVGGRQDTAAGLVESGVGEQPTGEKGKGRRVLLGSLTGLESVYSESCKEKDRISGVEDGVRSSTSSSGDGFSRSLIDELLLGTGAVAQLKRIVAGELFAAAGSAVRIRGLLASTHVQKLGPGDEATAQLGSSRAEASREPGGTSDVEKTEGSSKKSKKKRKGGDSEVLGDVDQSLSENGRSADEVNVSGSRKKKRKVSQEETEAEQIAANPSAAAESVVSGPSPALATIGHHLAAASDVITSFLQRANRVSASHGSEYRQLSQTTVESAQMLAYIVGFLEAAGGCFPLLYPAPPIAAFDWLVETHLAMVGVAATSTLRLPSRPQTGGLEGALSAIRSRAEASFGTLSRGASRQQLLRVFQAVENDMADGQAGPRTEAAVGALAVLLESVSGAISPA